MRWSSRVGAVAAGAAMLASCAGEGSASRADGEGGGGSTWCASRPKGATVCVDFDEDGPVESTWAPFEVEGTYTEETAADGVSSAPRAVRFDSKAGGQASAARLHASFKVAPRRVRVAFEVRVAAVPAVGELLVTRYMAVPGPTIQLRVGAAETVLEIGSTLTELPFSTPIAAGAFHAVSIDVDFDARAVVAQLDGADVVRTPLAADVPSPGPTSTSFLELGAIVLPVETDAGLAVDPASVVLDDVVVDL
jgi:hypothetical protein